MTEDATSTAGPRLDALAASLRARGLAEHGDFYVHGRLPDTVASSEHIGIWDRDGTFEVWYHDMGRDRVLVETADFEVARERFVAEAVRLATGRGRRVKGA